MATKLVLLERVENLGKMGDVVTVRPGYARNFLLPQKKALRASKENIAYFEAQKKHIEAESDKRKKAAEKLAKKIEGTKVPLIRQASEGGQLFGSVTARDIAVEASKASGETIERQMVQLNQNFKMLGLFPVDVFLHPEVKVSITINIARTAEEAETQAKTGKALIVEEGQAAKMKQAADEEAQLAAVLEQDALNATKEREASETAEAAEEAAESAEKSKARAAKKKAKKTEAPEESEEKSSEE
ncbi:MAG: 50S ribosomal protein L9 [Alphaproteobacteria bacterium]|nr:50S ribosomal protein L9 [Alphaproteobacteria bacterium]